jgi:hypothetical protein
MADHESSIKLANALDEIGLNDLAERAKDDEFNDFFSPHAFPIMKLVEELNQPSVKHKFGVKRMIERVKRGDFDGTQAESEAWKASPEGKKAMRDLLEGA